MSHTCVHEPIGLDECAFEDARTDFEALKLHDRNELCWAVVGAPDGAIAEDRQGRLLVRLRQEEARDIAAAMTEAIGEPAPISSLQARFVQKSEPGFQRYEVRLQEPRQRSERPEPRARA